MIPKPDGAINRVAAGGARPGRSLAEQKLRQPQKSYNAYEHHNDL